MGVLGVNVMERTTTTADAQHDSFPQAILAEGLDSGTVRSPDGERVIAHIMPADLNRTDELAAQFGLERVDDELDRRTYAPINHDN